MDKELELAENPMNRGSSMHQLETSTKSRRLSVIAHPKTTPKLQATLSVKLALYVCVGIGSFGIFLLSYFLYRGQSQTVLVDGSQLAQCSTSEQIYSSPPMRQGAEVFVQAYDANSNLFKVFNFYAEWTACDAGYIGSEVSEVFVPAVAQMCSYLRWDHYCPNYPHMDYYSYPFGVDLTVDGKTSQISQTRSGVTEVIDTDDAFIVNRTDTNPCFNLVCSQGPQYNSSGGMLPAPNWKTLVNTNCAVGDPHQNFLEVIGVINVRPNGVSATCSAVICGQVIQVYQISQTVQPSGVYRCTIDNSVANSISSSFSNTLVGYNLLTLLCMTLFVSLSLGCFGMIKFIRRGGEIRF